MRTVCHDWPLFKANFHLQKIYIEFEGSISKVSELEAGSDLLPNFFWFENNFRRKGDFLRSFVVFLISLSPSLSFENIPPHFVDPGAL